MRTGRTSPRPLGYRRPHDDMLLPVLVGALVCLAFINPSILFYPLACGLVWVARGLERL